MAAPQASYDPYYIPSREDLDNCTDSEIKRGAARNPFPRCWGTGSPQLVRRTVVCGHQIHCPDLALRPARRRAWDAWDGRDLGPPGPPGPGTPGTWDAWDLGPPGAWYGREPASQARGQAGRRARSGQSI